MACPDGAVDKESPAKQETQVRSLGQGDLLEKEMATHSSILAWEISSLPHFKVILPISA